MLITVALSTWNRQRLLAGTLEQMSQLVIPPGTDWELIVVDNRSSDGTDDVLRSFANRLPLRPLFEPTPGKSYALNRAVKEAHGQYIVFTDDDVLPDPRWLSAYGDAFRRYPDAAFFGGPITPVFSGSPPAWLIETRERLASAFAARDFGPDPVPLTGDRKPYGANMAIRASDHAQIVYDATLGPRGRTILPGEETRVVDDLLDRGARGWWVPGARLDHVIPAERQTTRFIRRYYTGYGRFLSTADRSGDTAMLLGRPRWAWREAVRAEISYRIKRIVAPPSGWIDELISASVAWGRLWGPRRHPR